MSYNYSKYHEILPGVGAFTMNPTQPTTDLEIFLKEVIKHQSDRFTQMFRMNYYIHDTLIKNSEILKHSYTQYNLWTESPPSDIYVLKVYIESYYQDNNDDFTKVFLPAIIEKQPQNLPPNFHQVRIALIYIKDKNILCLGKISNLTLTEAPKHFSENLKNNFYYLVSIKNKLLSSTNEIFKPQPLIEVKSLYELKDFIDLYFPEWQLQ